MKQYALALAVLVSMFYPLAAAANTREAPPVIGTDRAIPHDHGGGGGGIIKNIHVVKIRTEIYTKFADVGGGADKLEKKKKYGCRSISCY